MKQQKSVFPEFGNWTVRPSGQHSGYPLDALSTGFPEVFGALERAVERPRFPGNRIRLKTQICLSSFGPLAKATWQDGGSIEWERLQNLRARCQIFDTFAFQCDLDLGVQSTVLVLFSCHCFTRSFARDARPLIDIPLFEIFDDGREKRVLCPERYQTSRRLLRDLVLSLPTRRIIVADERQPNFMTVETTNALGEPSLYAVFFEVEKDKTRKHRLLLRIQSAYTLDQGLTKRQRQSKKVMLRSILRAAVEGRTIRS